ncbi:IclR family transcriptional regulator [Protaetiibacter mangrovi]|uniref:Helix-turn-helix domain-containing protein n=1 Tax=Protaetiibacter mangrovi TaxID=2970926 RepID=A0ABT1ZFM3_9MICO|nr:helix-turn-helix domain-containing protein [Protaetiibacter mangrovi]MCS0499513.1 helix-turn-helix domain-containing protein [Protaetiibacter mangrovi]TPX04989.1 helix-turn-helix domain-containing protein [Schumannella luteola]
MSGQPDYSAPAVDKALDVLEVLADRAEGATQTELAEATGRSVGQIFRVLVVLENRGWIIRDRASGLYSLSMAPFDLAHRHPPLRGLLVAATPVMRGLAAEIRQSCNLAVLDGDAVRVVAQVESPADFGYRVRVGAAFPLASATGTVLVAGAPPELRAALAGAVDPAALAEVATDGSLRRHDPREPGIADLVATVRDARGHARAALTVPYVATSFSEADADRVRDLAIEAAAAITTRLAGAGGAAG